MFGVRVRASIGRAVQPLYRPVSILRLCARRTVGHYALRFESIRSLSTAAAAPAPSNAVPPLPSASSSTSNAVPPLPSASSSTSNAVPSLAAGFDELNRIAVAAGDDFHPQSTPQHRASWQRVSDGAAANDALTQFRDWLARADSAKSKVHPAVFVAVLPQLSRAGRYADVYAAVNELVTRLNRASLTASVLSPELFIATVTAFRSGLRASFTQSIRVDANELNLMIAELERYDAAKTAKSPAAPAVGSPASAPTKWSSASRAAVLSAFNEHITRCARGVLTLLDTVIDSRPQTVGRIQRDAAFWCAALDGWNHAADYGRVNTIFDAMTSHATNSSTTELLPRVSPNGESYSIVLRSCADAERAEAVWHKLIKSHASMLESTHYSDLLSVYYRVQNRYAAAQFLSAMLQLPPPPPPAAEDMAAPLPALKHRPLPVGVTKMPAFSPNSHSAASLLVLLHRHSRADSIRGAAHALLNRLRREKDARPLSDAEWSPIRDLLSRVAQNWNNPQRQHQLQLEAELAAMTGTDGAASSVAAALPPVHRSERALLSTYHQLLASFARGGQVLSATELLRSMLHERVRPDAAICNHLLTAYATSGETELFRSLWAAMLVRSGVDTTAASSGAPLARLPTDVARMVVAPNSESFTIAMRAALEKGGAAGGAAVFECMRQIKALSTAARPVSPVLIHYHIALIAAGNELKDWNRVDSLIAEMKSSPLAELHPTIATYNRVLKLFSSHARDRSFLTLWQSLIRSNAAKSNDQFPAPDLYSFMHLFDWAGRRLDAGLIVSAYDTLKQRIAERDAAEPNAAPEVDRKTNAPHAETVPLRLSVGVFFSIAKPFIASLRDRTINIGHGFTAPASAASNPESLPKYNPQSVLKWPLQLRTSCERVFQDLAGARLTAPLTPPQIQVLNAVSHQLHQQSLLQRRESESPPPLRIPKPKNKLKVAPEDATGIDDNNKLLQTPPASAPAATAAV